MKDMNGFDRDPYWLASQTRSFTATTARSSAFNAHTHTIQITATQICFVKLGDVTVEAAVTDHYIVAGVPYKLPVRGNTHIAVIRSSADGNLYITEMTD